MRESGGVVVCWWLFPDQLTSSQSLLEEAGGSMGRYR